MSDIILAGAMPAVSMSASSVTVPGSYIGTSDSTYNMLRDKGRRRAPRNGKTHESVVLPQRKRDKAGGTIYDLVRNDITAQWAFGKYLDYTTTFYFQSMTGDAEFDEALEHAVAWYSLKENCDVARRHDLNRQIRLFGSGIGLDGDAGLLKVSDEEHDHQLQGIESDRIRQPSAKFKGTIPKELQNSDITTDGVIMDKYGAVDKYIICNRDGRSYSFGQAVDYNDIIFDGHFFRFDQVRGVSRCAAAVNKFKDIDETDEYQLIKCKKHAMHGLFFKSASPNATGFNEQSLNPDADPSGDSTDSSAATTSGPKYDFELEAGLKIEGEQGDEVDMFESKNPSNEYQAYSELMLRKGFLSFSVPYSFFDSRKSSYSANKQDRVEFITSIKPDRRINYNALCSITYWILPWLIEKFKLKIPKKFTLESLPFDWIPEAEPWLDENNEVDAAGKRMALGLSNPEIECRRHGLNAYDVARGNKRFQTYIRRAEIVTAIGLPGQAMLNDQSTATDTEKSDQTNKTTDKENTDNGEK